MLWALLSAEVLGLERLALWPVGELLDGGMGGWRVGKEELGCRCQGNLNWQGSGVSDD